ncbi:MAG: dihydrolipoyl dehydrogenase [Christensenellaceae bacterium]|jgi:dihydrolipoamide dehydrogenase
MIYDLIVLGGGPAGYLACERAAEGGMHVLLLEKNNVGGVCLNEGCIPSKTLLYSAKIKDNATDGEKYGVSCENVQIDHAAVIKRKNKVVKKLTAGVAAALRNLKVEWVRQAGKIKEKSGGGYTVLADDGAEYIGKRLLVATGSEAVMPPIDGLAEQFEAGFVLTSREMLNIAEVPEKLVVVGGGVIGLEMASYFHSAGSEVTVVEMLPAIGGAVDRDVAELLRKNYEAKGIAFKTECKVMRFEPGAVIYEENGQTVRAECSKALVSIGRRPNTSGIGLENIGVQLEHGAIKTDEKMQTNVQNVYAAGDVNGKSMLAHTAYREAEVAVNNMLGKADNMAYNAIPGIIYTNPEAAGVGETEQTALKKGMDVTIRKIPMAYAGRYVAENERGDGFIKIIVDNKQNTLTGVHMVANYASEIIWGVDALIARQVSIEEIKKIVFPHPTVSEIVREAVFRLDE